MSVTSLIGHKNNVMDKIHRLCDELEALKKEINELDKQIYYLCKHEWVIDRYTISEHTQYECSKCGLGKFHNNNND
jgi:transcription initiation factor IIE alpha subunit